MPRPLFESTRELLLKFLGQIRIYGGLTGGHGYEAFIAPNHFKKVGADREPGEPPTDDQHTAEEAYLDFMLLLIQGGRINPENIAKFTQEIFDAGPELEQPKGINLEVEGEVKPDFDKAIEIEYKQRHKRYLDNNQLGLFFAAFEKLCSPNHTLSQDTRNKIQAKARCSGKEIESLEQNPLSDYSLLLRLEITKEFPDIAANLPKEPKLAKPQNFNDANGVYDKMVRQSTIRYPDLSKSDKKAQAKFRDLRVTALLAHSKNPSDAPLLIDSLYDTARLLHGEITSQEYLEIAQKIKQDNKAAAKYKCHGKISALMIGIGLALIAAGVLTFGTTTAAGLGLVSTGAAVAVGGAVVGFDSHRLFKRAKATQATKERLGEEMGKVAKHAPKPGGGSEGK